ncbi:DNA-binding XRE family transcriptional regulator [Salsuginibacillus halophilus]|uniref:DNA-binding XRE family transcriptional regulator n=1 Tax=Salsuginibacillus halophilus TaxID=517424 RepID=A0A2P8H7T3_9BACI|nr:helix-turn-helix transcriptional regulator [Salsuginibacillus halophilus]PSL42282.1 DNA-binding XRE family transcriptional regulator [Salsuginibacillus halophilus]
MEEVKWAGRVRAFRKLKGYTQEDLAGQIGVSVSLLGSIERGMRELDETTLQKIIEVLGITKEELRSK